MIGWTEVWILNRSLGRVFNVLTSTFIGHLGLTNSLVYFRARCPQSRLDRALLQAPCSRCVLPGAAGWPPIRELCWQQFLRRTLRRAAWLEATPQAFRLGTRRRAAVPKYGWSACMIGRNNTSGRDPVDASSASNVSINRVPRLLLDRPGDQASQRLGRLRTGGAACRGSDSRSEHHS